MTTTVKKTSFIMGIPFHMWSCMFPLQGCLLR